MLFGAAKMWNLANDKDFGNPTNYFMDAAFVHARNLYNFFTGRAVHDASVRQFTQEQFDLSLYYTWKDALHNHVLHVNDSRSSPNNVIGRVHLNKQVQKFADDIGTLWEKWINITTDQTLKSQLEKALEKARKESQDDYNFVEQKLAVSK
jgi:hypothetical protein